MAEFHPIWVSTDAQVAALMRAYSDASLATKLLGRYQISPGVAHLRGILTPWMRIPVVFVAQGRLSIHGDGCAFTPQRHRVFGWRLRGGDADLTFRIRSAEIVAVEPADLPSPVAGFFDLPFTRVQTTHAGPAHDFLLCFGGRLNLPQIRARSLELRRALQAMAGAAASSDSAAT